MLKIATAAALISTALAGASAHAVVLVDAGGFASAGGQPRTQPLDFSGISTVGGAEIGFFIFEAVPGFVFGDGVNLSTEQAGAILMARLKSNIGNLTLPALGLNLGIQDGSSFAFVDGVIDITVRERFRPPTTLQLATHAGNASFAGLLSDTNITGFSLGIRSYDIDATAAPFVTLTGSYVYRVVPLPAGAASLLPALAVLALAGRSRS